MMKTNKATVFGGALLIAGCCIGAGMLGLPVLSARSGFVPSGLAFIFAWGFMLSSGLLLLEVNLWFKEEVSIISMVGQTLGRVGQAAAWFLYLFLFYSLLVAYVAGSGALLSGVLDDFGILLPFSVGSILFTVLFAILVYIGTGVVDRFNQLLMLGLVISYLGLLFLGLEHIQPQLLAPREWSAVRLVIPAMVVSFGFHNLIPSLTTYFNHDAKRLTKVVVLGSAIPLVIYLFWQMVILGIVPPEQFELALDAGDIATSTLKKVTASKAVMLLAEHFAFFALVSSLLAVSLSFVDFLADGLSIQKTPLGKLFLVLLSFVPPLISSFLFPGIFLTALSFGAIAAALLFGVLPAMMVWKGRSAGEAVLLPGGRTAIVMVFLAACAVIGIKLVDYL